MTEQNPRQTLNQQNTGSARARILCIVDRPDWIFRRHVAALDRYLGTEFDFSWISREQSYEESAYDLIYPLEFDLISANQIKDPGRYVTGIRSFVSWADWDFLALCNYLSSHFRGVHVVSKQLYDLFSPYIPGVLYVTHGTDTEFFKTDIPPSMDTGKLRLGWAGNRQTYVKGFREFVEPLSSLPGIELVYYGFSDRNLTIEEMPGFYQSIDAYVCASSFEGNNNSLLEAAAMNRPIIATATGTAPEYLQHNLSALFVERNLDEFKAAAVRLRDDPELRVNLGQQARISLTKNGWDWRNKAEDYRQFFRAALEGKSFWGKARTNDDLIDFRHYARVLHTQHRLVRDLRIGFALQAIDLSLRVNALEKELAATTTALTTTKTELARVELSRWYLLGLRINANPLVKTVRGWLFKHKNDQR